MSDGYVPVHLVAYDDDADLEIEDGEAGAVVANHDELVNSGQTHDEIRMLKRDSLPYSMESEIVEPGDPLWSDEVAAMEPGDVIRLSESGVSA